MPTKFIFGFAILLAVASGCSSSRIGDFTAMSTKNLYAKNVDISKLPRVEGVEGSDVRFLGGGTIQEALDHALEKGHGNLMIDAVIYVDSAPFFGGFRVRGTVIDVPYTDEKNPPMTP